jgi:hypothetical protein
MTYSYIEENVPKLIVRFIFRKFRGLIATQKRVIDGDSIRCPYVNDENSLTTRPIQLHKKCEEEQR